MSDRVKVSVVKYPDRERLVLRWRDPITDKWRCKLSNTTKRRDAERAAADLEKEIMEGHHGPAARMGWGDFRDYHERHCLSGLKGTTGDGYSCALNVYERFHKPIKASDITAARITAWQTKLRTEGKSAETIKSYTKQLMAVLRWGHAQGLLPTVPKLPRMKRSKAVKLMKGRPIKLEEFERMLLAVPSIVGADAAQSWEHYLRGLWWSGLRLSESLKLRWTSEPGALVVDLSGRRPMLRIPAESEKGGQDRLLPLAPEFAAFLDETPEADRVGRVFKLFGLRWSDAQVQADWVSRVVCRIGRKARIVVDERESLLAVDARSESKKRKPSKRKKKLTTPETNDGIKRKYASAHDLRRAFGLRWASRVMPAVLQQLMRHEDISTTLRYYVGRDAESIADTLWEAVAAKPATTAKRSVSTKSGTIARQFVTQ